MTNRTTPALNAVDAEEVLESLRTRCDTAVADLLLCRPEIVGTFCPGGTCSLLGTKEEEKDEEREEVYNLHKVEVLRPSFFGDGFREIFRKDGRRRLWRVPSGINFPGEQFITRCARGRTSRRKGRGSRGQSR